LNTKEYMQRMTN